MNKWILSQIASGSPYGVMFEEEGGAGGEEGGGEGEQGGEGEGGEEGGEQPSFSYAEGVDGEGDVPDWFKSDKYGTVADQAKAYKELEGKFGAFTGAPEAYEVKISEELTEAGIVFEADDPLLEKAMEYAKEAGMDQGGFEGMLNLYGMARLGEEQAWESYKADEMKALGQNAQGRVDSILKWADANMGEEHANGLKSMGQTAAQIQSLEQLISMTSAAPLTPGGDPTPGGITQAELTEMQFAKDEHGNRKINTDKEFGRNYRAKLEEFHGKQDHTIVVGV